MSTLRFVDEIGARLSGLAEGTPIRDIEKNLKALAAGAFSRLDLVSREEFEVQRELLARARERLAALEARVAALEAGMGGKGQGPEIGDQPSE
ncbi:MAG: accessory factor UbiK family protein [Azoarcus sp.]|jgi:BMFP domain-containing protein YqiC|nr:accessory factor UbiK family protein [Azoarcus sp.]